MPQDEPTGPDLSGVIADANAAGLQYVVIGGFGVIYHGYIRATRDTDLLVPDGQEADAAILRFLQHTDGRRMQDDKALTPNDVAGSEHLRVHGRHGIVDILRGGIPPLDFETVVSASLKMDIGGHEGRVADLGSLVGLKRLANRPQDRLDLSELEAIHGSLPIKPIPGLDR